MIESTLTGDNPSLIDIFMQSLGSDNPKLSEEEKMSQIEKSEGSWAYKEFDISGGKEFTDTKRISGMGGKALDYLASQLCSIFTVMGWTWWDSENIPTQERFKNAIAGHIKSLLKGDFEVVSSGRLVIRQEDPDEKIFSVHLDLGDIDLTEFDEILEEL